MGTADILKLAGSVVALLIAIGAALDYFLIHGQRQSRLHAAACGAWLKFDDTPIESLYLLMAHWPARTWMRITKGDRFRAYVYGGFFSFVLTYIAAAVAPFEERRGSPNVWLQLYYGVFKMPAIDLALNLPGDMISVLFTAYVLRKLSSLFETRAVTTPQTQGAHERCSPVVRSIALLGVNLLVAGTCALLSFTLFAINHAVSMGLVSGAGAPRTDLGIRFWDRFLASLSEWFSNFPRMRPHTRNVSFRTFVPIATYVASLALLVVSKPVLRVLKRLGLSIGDRILTDGEGGKHASKFQPFKAMSYVLSVIAALLAVCAGVVGALGRAL